MKTQIYFYSNNAFNAIVFKQSEKFFFLTDHTIIDLYADDTVDQLKAFYKNIIANGNMDLSGLCNSNYVYAGNFTADDDSEDAILIAEYDDEDYSPYVDGLI